MLPADLLTATLNRFTQADRPLIAVNPDQKNPAAALKLEVGQQIQATVQTQIAPGLFQVRIASQVLQMQLPAFVRSGDQIALQVLSLQPRLTFSLAASTNPLSTSEQLGSTARLLSSLAQQPVRQEYVPAQRAPLWLSASASPDTVQLAEKLHQALSHSGLFYESHQAQWIAGTRSTPQLLAEPHNQLPPQTAPATGQERHTIPEPLQAIVQQQLHALENRQVVWQGPVWPGQEMRWEVGEESRQPQPAAAEKQWVTELHLDLPQLGGISARLRFSGAAVAVEIDLANAQTGHKLQAASPELESALQARGVPVQQILIRRANGETA